ANATIVGVTLGTEPGTLVIQVAMEETAARTLQQFETLYATQEVVLDNATFPLLSHTTDVVATYPPPLEPTPPTQVAVFDAVCSGCPVGDACTNGMCTCTGCVSTTPGVVCVSGGGSVPDACTSADTQYTTDDCESRGGRVNLFPRRRYCHARGYPYGTSPSTVQAVFGNGTRTYALALVGTLGATQQDAYASGLEGEPLRAQRYARAEYATLAAPDTLQLSKMTYLDAVEGAAEYAYNGTAWVYTDCAALGYTGAAYAWWNATQAACDCFVFNQHNPASGVCEPGCVDGRFGAECQLLATPLVCAYAWNATSMAYMRAADCTPVCRTGYTGAECTQPDDTLLFDGVAYGTSVAGLSGVGIAVVVLASLVGIGGTAAGAVAAPQLRARWQQRSNDTTTTKPLSAQQRPLVRKR
ncbi:MAG: hypothetical protein Q7V62_03665, partial [Actinomycetota bacterium]|nr:hypothetical protein [Actinomycetota bacterium]